MGSNDPGLRNSRVVPTASPQARPASAPIARSSAEVAELSGLAGRSLAEREGRSYESFGASVD